MTTKSQAISRLQRALDEIPRLKALGSGNAEFEKWYRNTEIALANTFGDASRHIRDFAQVSYSLGVYTFDTPDSAFDEAYRGGLDSASSVLQSMLEEVEEYWEEEGSVPSADSPGPIVDVDDNRTDVFVVHGRDDAAKESVARFIERLGLHPIILHEQANEGRTIIEKFERHSSVGFAVALLTPDDVGAFADDSANLRPRARQNVVLELGYFMGRLGRNRVCTLLKGGVEPPSDISGIVYTPLDVGGAWKLALVRELKSAGYDIDANLAL